MVGKYVFEFVGGTVRGANSCVLSTHRQFAMLCAGGPGLDHFEQRVNSKSMSVGNCISRTVVHQVAFGRMRDRNMQGWTGRRVRRGGPYDVAARLHFNGPITSKCSKMRLRRSLPMMTATSEEINSTSPLIFCTRSSKFTRVSAAST